MPTVRMNDHAIEAAYQEAWRETMLLLGRKFTKEITSVKWDWTVRSKDGSIRSEKRDIIDDGILRGSQLPTEVSPTITDWSWPVEYSLAVHNGVTFRNGTSFPARRWTQKPLEDLPKLFSKICAAELGGVK